MIEIGVDQIMGLVVVGMVGLFGSLLCDTIDKKI